MHQVTLNFCFQTLLYFANELKQWFLCDLDLENSKTFLSKRFYLNQKKLRHLYVQLWSFHCSSIKTWTLTSNFPNRKSFWHMKDMNTLSRKIPDYKHGCVRNRVFMASERLISHNHVSCEPHEVESRFIAQIKRKINILTRFEISRLKNQSLWIK